MAHGIGDHRVQRLVDVDRHHVAFVGARLLQCGELGDQHLRFEEVAVTRRQSGFDHRELAVQVDKRQVAVAGAQAVAILLFSAEQTMIDTLLVRCMAKAASLSAANHGARSSSFNASPAAIFRMLLRGCKKSPSRKPAESWRAAAA